ncbi:MAG: 2Fe-2S iron-sulfur cluster binding domain-containing protein [Alphaproteobacteria bacterium]|nr:2Fe-2S iron-sulfur cluster binding domain-containing protein [Alphaproteobacteria bacterium]
MHIVVTDTEGKEHNLPAVEEWSVMEIIREGGLPILAQCGGSCACATCHVYIGDTWQGKLPEPNEEEIGMLDGAFEVKPNSRLACQLIFNSKLDGLQIVLAPGSV